MKYVINLIAVIALSVGASSSLAWESAGDAKLVEIIQFEQNINRDYLIAVFEQDNGATLQCHVLLGQETLTSLLLALYVSGNKSTVHCNDTVLDIGGLVSHRLHRIIAGQ